MKNQNSLFLKWSFPFIFFFTLLLFSSCSEEPQTEGLGYVPKPHSLGAVLLGEEINSSPSPEFSSTSSFEEIDAEIGDEKAQEGVFSAPMKSYQDTSKQFTFFYPKDWRLNIKSKKILIAYSPKNNGEEAEFYLEKLSFPNDIPSLEDIREKIVSLMEKEYPTSTIEKTEAISLGNRNIIKIFYNDSESEKETSYLHVICEENGEIYAMSYIGERNVFQEYFSEANEMIQKFIITHKE